MTGNGQKTLWELNRFWSEVVVFAVFGLSVNANITWLKYTCTNTCTCECTMYMYIHWTCTLHTKSLCTVHCTCTFMSNVHWRKSTYCVPLLYIMWTGNFNKWDVYTNVLNALLYYYKPHWSIYGCMLFVSQRQTNYISHAHICYMLWLIMWIMYVHIRPVALLIERYTHDTIVYYY